MPPFFKKGGSAEGMYLRVRGSPAEYKQGKGVGGLRISAGVEMPGSPGL